MYRLSGPHRVTWRAAGLALGVAVAMLTAGCTSNPPPEPSVTTPSALPSPVGPTTPTIPADAPLLEAKTLKLAWVGDVNFGTKGRQPPGGVGTIFANLTDHLKSDLTMGNLETVLGTAPLTRCSLGTASCYMFEAPPDTAAVLKDVGFSALNLANNHTLDAGTDGMEQTKAALRDAGLVWVGEPGQITYVTAAGVDVALLGFGPNETSSDCRDLPTAQKMVQEAKQHAQVVVVMIHMGQEGVAHEHLQPGHEIFEGWDRGDTMEFAHGVIDAGADLVVGSGPHVLRGMQWYKGRLIAYSLGDFSGYNTLPTSGDFGLSGILNVTLDPAGGFIGGSVTPLRLVATGTPTVDPDGRAWTLMNSLSSADFGDTGAVISADGTILPPVA